MKSINSNKQNNNSIVDLDIIEKKTKESINTIHISQKKNYANEHGFHYRSSAQFYFKVNSSKDINTSLILFNYFKIKNQNEVSISVTLRDSKGKFIDRKHLNFGNHNVIIIDAETWKISKITGSVEVEYFSLKNLVIPYAAIIGVYKTKYGISYVHTYSRNYSKHEMETGFKVMESCESNWTIRDSKEVESFTILHNGFLRVEEQDIRIKVTSESGRVLEKGFFLRSLNPYEIVEIIPQEIFRDLSGWLNHEQANCSITFKVNGAFTRTLVGNRTKSNTDMQVTHSNFAYNYLKTDFIDTFKGVMPYPTFNVKDGQINIYPDMPSGEYFISFEPSNKNQKKFLSGQYISHKLDDKQDFNISLGKVNSDIPSRIVIGFSGRSMKASNNILPYEISLGVFTKARPKKRFWWGPIGNSETKNSLIIGLLKDIYGEYGKQELILRIYNDQNDKYIETIYSSEELISKNFRIEIDDLNLKDIKKYGMYTVFSQYPGFFVYSLTENKDGSIAIEHGF